MNSSQSDDVVNHPNHYTQYNGFEVIDVCEQLRAPDGSGNYNRGNAFKYLARAGWKSPEKHLEDLQKAEFYIRREIDRVASNNWSDKDSPGMSSSVQEVSLAEQGADTSSFHIIRCSECSESTLRTNDDLRTYYCTKGHGALKRVNTNA